ncbi:hypothetical protein AL056_27440 [Pseudomonas amygdali pv. morsprunorum]|uniref:Uncharacterized protein n=1 Tax=Pseudomonas syringae TaxID=317 RepID=A0A2K4WWP4_PSESX|nr:hypothetical protein BKM19_013260 [Pseudomonas amygdali pv. morsprunorum]SOS40288.1 hypothetical protein CFBP3840_03246 [Pseudomonas syringae]KWS56737.1 hypothetical protein AL056_27440 [Pseudomonas amygdali pv. morsprunorum]KWS62752.1 hypothetical protein AL054_04120 [Pseudomonas amygdali pv. morsprunorum]PHX36684.1 hypothetical protein AO282_28955 [Pseudomonas amygdali pv. morsprunorum]
MIALNGWQRLWVVACAVLLVVMASTAASRSFPTAERIESSYAFDRYMHDNNLGCLENEAANARAGIVAPVSICLNSDPAEVRRVFAEDTASYEYRRTHVLMLQLESAGWIIVGWLLLCGALYLLGLILAWIIRGFRPRANVA